MITMEAAQVDEDRLESDLGYRFGYIMEFMEFGEEDIAAIHGAAGYLAPAVDHLVDAVYEKLFTFDATKRHFLVKTHGYKGELPEALAELDLDHPQVHFRKGHLKKYLTQFVTSPFDGKLLDYLDLVGMIHTDKGGTKAIKVPLIHVNALMGYVSSALTSTIMKAGLDPETARKSVVAFNKLLWLQNDSFQRWYMTRP